MKKNRYTRIVLRKELKDAFRDRRTILTGMLMPLVLYPLIFWLMGSSALGAQKEAVTNTTIALIDAAQQQPVQEFLTREVFEGNHGIKFAQHDDAKQALADGDVKLVLSMTEEAATALLSGQQADIALLYNDTKAASSASLQVVTVAINNYNNRIVSDKLKQQFNTSLGALQPIHMGTPQIYNETIANGGESSGGNVFLSMMIPLLLLIMLSVGSMAAAVDMFAGEKERRTLEPLLTTHAGRSSILSGKFLAVSLLGLLTTLLTLLGMVIGFAMTPEILEQTSEAGATSSGLNIPIPAVALCVLLVVVVQLSFSAIHVMLSAYARNIKEASTYSTFVMMAGMIPAYATMYLQSGDVSTWMMFVPVLNVAGALKMLLGGLLDYGLVAISLAISLAFLAVLLRFTARMFHKESIMLRS